MAKPGGGGGPALKWTGTTGNDTATIASLSDFTRTTYDARGGYDTLDLHLLSAGITVDISLSKGSEHSAISPTTFTGSWWDFDAGSTIYRDTLNGFEKIIGTDYGDNLSVRGGSVARVVDAGAGDDAIQMGGSSGTNTLIGGTGQDQLFGSYSTDLMIGGTYNGTVATPDGERDEFEAYAGTILDFEVGKDVLYIDASGLPGGVVTSSWTTVSYGSGSAAQLQLAPGRTITLVGVSATEMNSHALGYVLYPGNGSQVTSGAGDDFIWDSSSTTATRYNFGSGSGHDELVGFDVGVDTLVLPDAPAWTPYDYHGQASLLATFDSGHSSVLVIGISNPSSITVEYPFG